MTGPLTPAAGDAVASIIHKLRGARSGGALVELSLDEVRVLRHVLSSSTIEALAVRG